MHPERTGRFVCFWHFGAVQPGQTYHSQRLAAMSQPCVRILESLTGSEAGRSNQAVKWRHLNLRLAASHVAVHSASLSPMAAFRLSWQSFPIMVLASGTYLARSLGAVENVADDVRF